MDQSRHILHVRFFLKQKIRGIKDQCVLVSVRSMGKNQALRVIYFSVGSLYSPKVLEGKNDYLELFQLYRWILEFVCGSAPLTQWVTQCRPR
jgi:hypothetical protein